MPKMAVCTFWSNWIGFVSRPRAHRPYLSGRRGEGNGAPGDIRPDAPRRYAGFLVTLVAKTIGTSGAYVSQRLIIEQLLVVVDFAANPIEGDLAKIQLCLTEDLGAQLVPERPQRNPQLQDERPRRIQLATVRQIGRRHRTSVPAATWSESHIICRPMVGKSAAIPSRDRRRQGCDALGNDDAMPAHGENEYGEPS